MRDDLQTPFAAGVVIQTTGRPLLGQAVRSVFAQDLGARIQILIGVDHWASDDRALLDALRSECPTHCALTIFDPGYSTSRRHGGFYSNQYGGSLRTILSYAANSQHVAYLDDDDWWAPQHLRELKTAIAGKDWAFAYRQWVLRGSDEILARDTWESVGPNAGVYSKSFGGFVCPSALMLDKMACHTVLPEWCIANFAGGSGEDRRVFKLLKDRPYGQTGNYSVYYRTQLTGLPPFLLWKFKQAGVDLARYLRTDEIPGDAVWAECESAERREQLEAPATSANVFEMNYSPINPGRPAER